MARWRLWTLGLLAPMKEPHHVRAAPFILALGGETPGCMCRPCGWPVQGQASFIEVRFDHLRQVWQNLTNRNGASHMTNPLPDIEDKGEGSILSVHREVSYVLSTACFA